MVRHGLSVAPGHTERPRQTTLHAARDALRRYFRGDLDAPSAVELDLEGSALQRRVWALLGRIEPGETITYGELASRARQKGAFRAIGAANGANPCAIFVPCHRVVGATGALQGYGGGLAAKSWLLAHEGVANDGRRLTPNREEDED
ncbi:methylated-DNA--[protein]-cysteine S-methyltransferase [Myxococcota bacterium]|nr:methylated-DNA--[protein]-cysteine S-methyltransferase [Myxococcota bacterium]